MSIEMDYELCLVRTETKEKRIALYNEKIGNRVHGFVAFTAEQIDRLTDALSFHGYRWTANEGCIRHFEHLNYGKARMTEGGLFWQVWQDEEWIESVRKLAEKLARTGEFSLYDFQEGAWVEVRLEAEQPTEHEGDLPGVFPAESESPDHMVFIERDGVCTGNGSSAPNFSYLAYRDEEMLSEFIAKIADYLPGMKNVVWAIWCKPDIIAYLYSDDSTKYKWELDVPDMMISKLPVKGILCTYFREDGFLHYEGVYLDEMFPDCDTLLQQVKAYYAMLRRIRRENTLKQKGKEIHIRYNRKSVCMGDDVDAGERILHLSPNAQLQDLILSICNGGSGCDWPLAHVTGDKCWVIRSNIGILAYIMRNTLERKPDVFVYPNREHGAWLADMKIEWVYADYLTQEESEEFLRLYIERNRLATEYLFKEWEEFLRLVYECNHSVDMIDWFEHQPENQPHAGGYRDPLNRLWMYAETSISSEKLFGKSFKEVREYIRDIIYEYAGHEMVPAFCLREENPGR